MESNSCDLSINDYRAYKIFRTHFNPRARRGSGVTKCAKEVPIHSQLGPYFKEKRIYKATICRKKGNYQKELDKLFSSSINTNPNEFWKNLNPLKFVESYACALHTTAVTS